MVVLMLPRVKGRTMFYCSSFLVKYCQTLHNFTTMLKLSKKPQSKCCRVNRSKVLSCTHLKPIYVTLNSCIKPCHSDQGNMHNMTNTSTSPLTALQRCDLTQNLNPQLHGDISIQRKTKTATTNLPGSRNQCSADMTRSAYRKYCRVERTKTDHKLVITF